MKETTPKTVAKNVILPSDAMLKQANLVPTQGQYKLFKLWDDFIMDKTPQRHAFLLKGYAGTGKTTSVSLLVKVLPMYGYKVVLLAPTGRAAKVIGSYTNRQANTIHRIIYKTAEAENGKFVFEPTTNYYKNTVFIVDEASMIGDERDAMTNGLLSDLVAYIFENEELNNKLLLIGDTAQLPPVGQLLSPALEVAYLYRNFRLQVTEHLLTEVMRQEQLSGILENATALRNNIAQEQMKVEFITKSYKDIYRMTSEKLEDGLRYAYRKFGIENTLIVCRSNKAAVQFNQYIRRQILYKDSEIESGDYLLIVRNNYTWLPEDSPAVFLANGEFVQVVRVMRHEEKHGFRFVRLLLRLVDNDQHPPFEAVAHLGTLTSHEPNLSQEDNKKIYQAVMTDYEALTKPREKIQAIKKDEYLNALQIKFAYAMTCHKAQGGQWDVVFVEQGFLKEDMLNMDFLRWLYTALTRAVKELYLVNFHASFFGQK
jgi:ATP-dependent exoDNAse (exonuclease V) alpha subunit